MPNILNLTFKEIEFMHFDEITMFLMPSKLSFKYCPDWSKILYSETEFLMLNALQ